MTSTVMAPLYSRGFILTGFVVADGAIAICEMLFQTSLVALVGVGDEPTMSPRRLQIINTKVRPPLPQHRSRRRQNVG